MPYVPKGLECQVSKVVHSDTCPRPTAQEYGVQIVAAGGGAYTLHSHQGGGTGTVCRFGWREYA